ncbi:MAG: DUF4012 domain-containing protein [Patescibacteria group bacterium]
MTPITTDNSDAPSMHMPIALIQTQDTMFVEALREYLSRHGCLTIVNGHTEKKITYNIIIGDSEYVKGIVTKTKTLGEKTLVIIYQGGENDVNLYIAQNINVAIIDPYPLDEKNLRDLLLLLFTGSARSLITRKVQNLRRLQSVAAPPLRREPFKNVIEDATDRLRVGEIMQQIFKPTSHKEFSKKKIFSRRLQMVIATIMLTMLVFILSYVMSLIMAVAGLYATAKLLSSSKITIAQRTMRIANSGIETARMFVNISAPIGKLFGIEDVVSDNERIIWMFENLLMAEKNVVSIINSGRAIVADIFTSKEGGARGAGVADVIALRSEVVQFDQNLGLVQTELATLIGERHVPFIFSTISTYATKSLKNIEALRLRLTYFDRLLTLYPQLAGYRKKQTYLVLLQNSMELRPTGGFIGSIALITFLDGKVTDMEVQDVYTADGQLKGHIDPPTAIREILGQEHWYLRDSNWDPNFVHAGTQAAWFYEKEMGVTVDGVIGISVPFITKLLDATGPIELPDYKEHISSANFFAKSLLYTQADFFPGSTQKKDFLGSLMTAIITRLTTGKTVSIGVLFSAISSTLDAKDIQFYIPNTEISSVLQYWGWTGGIGSTACIEIGKDAPCTTEHVEVIEANLGVNKVNYFITREAASEISLSENGTIDHALSYTIANSSSAQILEGGGVYRSYVRVYFPQYTNLTSIELDGVTIVEKQANAKTPQSAPYYQVSSEGDKMVVGIYLVVDPLSSKHLTLATSRLSALSFRHKATLSVIIGKQAGIDMIPWKTTIRYPAYWTATTDALIAKQGELEYNTTLGKNYRTHILFEKTL